MKRIIFSLYFIYLVLLDVFSYIFVDPNLIYLKKIYSGLAFTQKTPTTIIYAIFVFVFFAFYLMFIKLAKDKHLSVKELGVLIILTCVILFFSYPAMLSYDIFNYFATSKVLFFYHENPYIIMPIEFTNDPILLFTHAANKTALYGSFWIILSGLPYFLGLGNFLISLFSFKLLASLFYLVTILSVYKVTKNIHSLALFALNPLVLIETLVSGHNDILMMFFAIFSIYLLTQKKHLFSLILLMLSILIKYATLFLLPFYLYVLINDLRHKKLNWDKLYVLALLLMFLIFLLSPLREEIYPWYGIWFLVFLPYIRNTVLKYLFIAFSLGLLLRYIPFMLLGTYLDPTPVLKFIFTFFPPVIIFTFLVVKFLWLRNRGQ